MLNVRSPFLCHPARSEGSLIVAPASCTRECLKTHSRSHSERSDGGNAGGAQSKNPAAPPTIVTGCSTGFFDFVPSRLRPHGTPLRMTPRRDFQPLPRRSQCQPAPAVSLFLQSKSLCVFPARHPELAKDL